MVQFIGLGMGLFYVFKLLGILGIKLFSGYFFYMSCWDYVYIGGDLLGVFLSKLQDKCVGIIGIGVIVVQCVLYLVRVFKELYVFQCMLLFVDECNNVLIDFVWFKEIVILGWQQCWFENFMVN